MGAVGYCLGGRVACQTALTLPVACAVSYYGGGIAPSPYFAAPMLLFWGGLDKSLGPETVQAVTAKFREVGKSYVNVEFSEADHGFFCDARAQYNPAAAAQSWAFTLAFLEQTFSAQPLSTIA